MGCRAQGVGHRVEDLVRMVWGAGHSTVSMGRLEGSAWRGILAVQCMHQHLSFYVEVMCLVGEGVGGCIID